MTAPRFEVLASEDTVLGPLCLRRRELLSEPGTLVVEMTLNHEFLMSSLHTESEKHLALGALNLHAGQQLRILIGGLGLGYTAAAALSSHRVIHTEVVEFLPAVIGWLTREIIPLAPQLNSDPRFHTVQGDIYEILMSPAVKRFDVILIDVDHSPDERLGHDNGVFYSARGLELARQHLERDGVLGMWSYAESPELADILSSVFGNLTAQPVTYFNRHVQQEFTDWLYFGRNSNC